MPRVLTVDDSSTIRTIISKNLSELGFEIEQAEDGQQALGKLEEIVVDLILLDVTMPVMDGPTMLEQLRATGNKTPVIMLTSESKRSIVSGAVKLGIEDYILKPFKPEEAARQGAQGASHGSGGGGGAGQHESGGGDRGGRAGGGAGRGPPVRRCARGR